MIFNYLHTIVQNPRKFLLVIFVLSLVLRLIFIFSLENKFYFSDSLAYEDCAMNILEGRGFGDFKRAPLYPLWVALVYFVAGGKSILVLRILDSLIGALICVVVYMLGKEVFNHRIGVIAAVISVFYPMFIFLSGLQYPTVLGTLLVTLAVYCSVMIFRRNKIYFSVLAGLSFGLATMAIVPAATLIIAALLWLLFVTDFGFKSKIAHSGMILTAILLPLLPWTVRNYVYHDKLVPIRDDTVRKMLLFEENGVNRKSTVGAEEKLKSIYQNPETFLRHFKENFLNFFRVAPSKYLASADPNYNLRIHEKDQRIVKVNKFSVSQFSYVIVALAFAPILFFAVFGLVLSGPCWRNSLLLFFITITFAITYAFFYGKVRYRIPVEPLMIVFAAHGFRTVLALARKRKISS